VAVAQSGRHDRLRGSNRVVGKTKDKESGVFETVLDWAINDDHYDGATHENGSRYEDKNNPWD
jgi:hypothetical protein